MVGFLTVAAGGLGMVLYRPGQTLRTMSTDDCDISINKNGAVDVRLTAGLPVFEDARPMVWMDGEDAPKPMSLSGRASTRFSFKDQLGEGNGMALIRKECEWQLHVYPSKPFLTVRVIYTNTGRSPVRVRALLPWTVGPGKKTGISLGVPAEQLQLLGGGGSPYAGDGGRPSLTQGIADSAWMVAAYAPGTGRSLIAGFLSAQRGVPRMAIAPNVTPGTIGLSTFTASCVYDPPIEVQPGGRLESETLYLSIAETSIHEGLERYGHAVGVWSGVAARQEVLPHGWDVSGSEYGPAATETQILSEAEVMSRGVRLSGWKHIALGDGWQRANGDWEPDPARFPQGLRHLTDALHELGLTAGLYLAPFLAMPDSPVAREHPDWLVEPVADAAAGLPAGARIVDVTAPGAAEYVRGLCRKVAVEWNFDALARAGALYHCGVAARYRNTSLTRMEVIQLALRTVREGLGPGKYAAGLEPLPTTLSLARGLRPGPVSTPEWTVAGTGWGIVESAENAARRYYYAPFVSPSDDDRLFLGGALSAEQQLSHLTALALTGQTLRFTQSPARLDATSRAALERLLPLPSRPARPLDLMSSPVPKVWVLPSVSQRGAAAVVAFFNWGLNATETLHLDLREAGLDPSRYYAVYDFWPEKYLGTVQNALDVQVNPGCVKVFGLRRTENCPTLLAVNRSLSLGDGDRARVDWNENARTLSGAFATLPDAEITVTLLCPEPYKPSSVTVSNGTPTVEFNAPLCTFRFRASRAELTEWSMQF